ncbi:CRISPR-associated endonuclease Cas2 [Pseudothermotoga sp.]
MPYYVITYDVSEQRVNKIRKILKKYFVWVQNSVFEGEISLGKLEKCKQELLRVIDQREDSIYIYKVHRLTDLDKQVIGVEKEFTDNFL